MDSYEVMHTFGNLNFTGYTYFQAVINASGTLGYKGETFTPTNTITLNIAIDSPSDVAGTTGTVVFLGKKKPELTKSFNSDGTWSIKG